MPTAGEIPEKSILAGLEYYGGYLYIAGGDAGSRYLSTFYRYSLKSYVWENITSSSTGFSPRYPATAIVGEFLYVIFGGAIGVVPDPEDIWRVNLTANDWAWEQVQYSGSISRSDMALALFSEGIYIFGGTNYFNYNELLLLQISPSSSTIDLTRIPNYIGPNARVSHSMDLLSSRLYLFGGLDNANYYNDLWAYDPALGLWTIQQSNGDIPSGRALHASSSLGDALLIWGGQDISGLRNDMFLFNTLTSIWTLVTPKSTAMPTPRKGACIVFGMPTSYIFGGESVLGVSSELWKYNFGSGEYSLVSEAGINIAYANCQIAGGVFYAFCGSTDFVNPVLGTNMFDLATEIWSNTTATTNCGTQGINLIIGNLFIDFGGRLYNLQSYNAFSVVTSSDTITEQTTLSPYNIAFSYFQSKLYFFSGGLTNIYGNILPTIPSSYFSVIDLQYLSTNYDLSVLCSPGTFVSGNSCEVCARGTYAEGYGNFYCTKCSAGKYGPNQGASSSRQCYPCATGTFTDRAGAYMCLECPYTYYCPLGSANFQALRRNQELTSIQPPNQNFNEYDNLISAFQTYAIIAAVSFMVVLSLIPAVIKNIKAIDIYNQEHNYLLDIPITLTHTTFGGIFTVLFLEITVILVISAFLNYYLSNFVETKALQPLPVLVLEVSSFIADIVVSASFYSYGDSCVENSACNPNINVIPSGFVQFTGINNCTRIENGKCYCFINEIFLFSLNN